DPEAMEHLIEALNDESAIVRRSAVLALRIMKDPRGIEALISSLSDDDQKVRDSSADALKHITGRNFRLDAQQWKKWWEQNKKAGSE
ncbi:MAG TPA: HEAT repeat domain-containing protein, partial [Nitrospirae bacterium]|nr:HEAT repeat domain-containing protein [Nitrospirota bacterium]